MPALLMRTWRVSTSWAALSTCEALVTSSARGVTRWLACSSTLRVPAYTLFAPRLSASLTSARPMPRLAPVIMTVLFVMFIHFSFSKSVIFSAFMALRRTKIRGAADIESAVRDALPEPGCSRDQKQSCPDGCGSDGSRHALTGRCDAFGGDGCRDD